MDVFLSIVSSVLTLLNYRGWNLVSGSAAYEMYAMQ
jgi:hypothetical protein